MLDGKLIVSVLFCFRLARFYNFIVNAIGISKKR